MSREPLVELSAARIALIFLALSAAYIALSDRLLLWLLADAGQDQLARMQTLKGLLYVSGTAALLWYLIRNAMAQLAEANQRLRLQAAISENTHAGVMITDHANRIEYINPAFTRITGYRLEDVVGRTPSLLSSGQHDAAFYEGMWAALEQDGVWQGEVVNRTRGGELFTEWITISRLCDKHERPLNHVAVFSDISEHKQAQDRLRYLAYRDPLTGLPNRANMTEQLHEALARPRRQPHQIAFCFLNIDDFKPINETMGHEVGDVLLQRLGERLEQTVGEAGVVGRFGGDTFVILYQAVTTDLRLTDAVECLQRRVRQPLALGGGRQVTVRASLGICLAAPGDSASSVISRADSALGEAKMRGKNNYVFYNRTMTRAAQRRLTLGQAMQRALTDGGFTVVYQPVFDLVDGSLLGAEALARWTDPELGVVSPAEFIPVAEATGMITQLGAEVLEQALAQCARWRAQDLAPGQVSVNVSARQLLDEDLLGAIDQALRAHALPFGVLELELTESVLMDLGASTLERLHALRAVGLSLAIDDFGTGYSSLSYLHRLPFGKLKLDRSFVAELDTSERNVQIVRATIAMARALGLKVQAEGVESPAQLEQLQALGAHCYQGYLRGKPMPADDFRAAFLVGHA